MWQARRVDTWIIGLIAVVVLGVAVIVFGALSDRSKNRRRAMQMMSPPERTIPRFDPEQPTPHYLSELQARRPPASGSQTEPSQAERQIAGQMSADHTVRLDCGFASTAFVTDRTTNQAALDAPVVLVCSDSIESFRELLGLLEKQILADSALVIVAPGIDAQALSTLEVNVIQQKLRIVVVSPATDRDLEKAAEVCDASPITRSDRQAGYLPAEALGHCTGWVSTKKASHIIPSADHSAGPS